MTTTAEAKERIYSSFIDELSAKLSTRRIPISTYRLQFNASFKFSDAAALVPYLADLGITDCYCSPYLAARPGSMHGYDLSDHNKLNPELGSEEDYQGFVDALKQHQMGQVLDFVPNHMGIIPIGRNQWWKEVLENGSSSPYARFFDIDWEPVKLELKGKVLLPILGDQYGQVLERGELQLGFEDGAVILKYYENALPINPNHSVAVHQHNLESLQTELGEDNSQLREYLSILTSLRNLPTYTESEPQRIIERQREKEVARERMVRLVEAAPQIRRHIEDNLRVFNGQPGVPESFDQLHELLEAQAYRLAYWRTAAHEINYRRFFDINELAGLRMEDPHVFAATHELILRLIREEKITGLRLDHIDGLFDPVNYLDRLQTSILEARAAALAPDGQLTEELRAELHKWREEQKTLDPRSVATRPLYVVVEKILSLDEQLPEDWMIHGTSGYDFLNDLNGVFIDPSNKESLRKIYNRFSGQQKTFAQIVYESKRRIMFSAMSSELNVLAYALNRISEGNRASRDFTLNSLRDALREVVACFFKYRTYVNTGGWTKTDRETIVNAVNWAQRRNPIVEKSIFEFITEVLLPQREKLSEDEYQRRLEFAMKFQQYTSPVEAKGVEDTAFYRYHLLLSLNEVGGDPERFGRSPSAFHAVNQQRLANWSYGMLATATHDTKRGEDVRARLNLLSEIPEEWSWELSKWELINAGNRAFIFEEIAPDRNDEYFFYQTLLGIWPAHLKEFADITSEARTQLIARLSPYLIKAIREAKVHTSWVNENHAYETAVIGFMEKTLRGPDAETFFSTFLPFQQRIAQLGMVNSLSQVVLKSAAPGVPDLYQGCELWDLSLVDPDNRRPVDYEHRRHMLAEIKDLDNGGISTAERLAAIAEMLEHWQDARVKLFVTTKMLQLRREMPELFLTGEYLALNAEAAFEKNVIAFARRERRSEQERLIIAIVPRFVAQLTTSEHRCPIGADSWKTGRIILPNELAGYKFRNLFTGEQVRPIRHGGQTGIFLAEALRTFPVAILIAE